MGISEVVAVVVFGSWVMLGMIMPPIVIHDYLATADYTSATCSGTLREFRMETNGYATHGWVDTCLAGPDGGCIGRNVTLHYPPIARWMILCESQVAVESWAAGLGSATTFGCLVDGDEGIVVHYGGLWIWTLWLMFASAFVLLICVACGGEILFGGDGCFPAKSTTTSPRTDKQLELAVAAALAKVGGSTA
jgi:hypothetical protein